MTEADFQRQVIHLAKLCGWHVYHAVPAQVRPGVWRTTYAGDRGFPDLVLAHSERGLLFVELKTDTGKVAPEQADWIAELLASGAEAYVWRPAQWPLIEARLMGAA